MRTQLKVNAKKSNCSVKFHLQLLLLYYSQMFLGNEMIPLFSSVGYHIHAYVHNHTNLVLVNSLWNILFCLFIVVVFVVSVCTQLLVSTRMDDECYGMYCYVCLLLLFLLFQYVPSCWCPRGWMTSVTACTFSS